MKDKTEAEDVVQNTYRSAWFNISKCRGESSLTTWLTQIALTEALERKREAEQAMVTLETVKTDQQTRARVNR